MQLKNYYNKLQVKVNNIMEMIEQGTAAFLGKVGMMALFAAVVHALNQYRTGGARSWKDIIILGIISFFFGFLTGLLTVATFGDVYMLYGVIGIAGWLGVEVSSLLTKFIVSKIK
ncbi:hypothetical protein EKK58_11165 [Candidatus Dependentiae bacterium]|nr:MAG: hypothetical protein EKK58_11165 [Candidatus Dependentiae bacterium]